MKIKIYFCFMLLAIFCAPSAFSTVDLETYGQLPTVQFMRVSPDGSKIAYRNVTEDKDVIVVYSLAKNKAIGAITVTDSMIPSNMYFLSENELVTVVSQHMRIHGYLGKHDVSNGYVLDIKKKKIKLLLEKGELVYRGQGSLGNIVGYSQEDGMVFMNAYTGGTVQSDEPRYSLFRVRLDRTDLRKIHERGSRHSHDFFVDDRGEVIAKEFYNESTNLHTIEAKVGKDWKEIYEEEAAVRSISPVGVTPDFKSLVVTAYNTETRSRSYFLMNLQTGEITDGKLSRPDKDIQYLLKDINRVVYGVQYTGFNPSYELFDPKANKKLNAIVKQFPGNSVHLQDHTPDWKSIVVSIEGSNFAGDYYLFTEGQEPRFLASEHPGLKTEQIHSIAMFNFRAGDDLLIPTLLTIPRDKLTEIKHLPAVVFPHGGPEYYDRIGFDWMAQALASQGYLVIQPQFRGSSGFGLDHRDAGRGEWGKKMQTDLNDALDTFAKKGYIDPERVCVVGMSYGGYAALAGGALYPERFKCVVSVNGVADLNDMLHSEKYRFGSDHWVVSYFENSMAKGKATKNYLREISPSRHADAFQAPVLLVHGENDEVVPIDQSKKMYGVLKKADKKVEFVELKDEGHHLATKEGRMQTLKATIEFVNKNIGR